MASHLPSQDIPPAELHRLIDLLPLIVWTSRVDGGNDFLNQYWFDYTGLSPTDSAGEQRWARALHPEDQARTFQQWQAVQESGEAFEVEYRLRRHDGQYRWFLGRAQSVRDEAGRVVKWFGTCTDIDDRKRAEGDFATLADTIPQLVWTTDPQGSHLYFNRRWTEFTGLTMAESLGPDVWNYTLHPDDQQRARERWEHSLQTGEFYEIEYRFKRHDDQYFWFLAQAQPIRDANGRITQWFGTCTDIDDRKRAEAALLEREAELDTLANNIPQLAWMADPTGHIFWYNRRWYEYSGTTLDEMQGWGWQQIHHPNHIGHVLETWRAAVEHGTPWEDTFPLRGADGQFRWFLSRAVPIQDAEGRILRWFGTNTDVTEQRQLQDQLRSSYEDLETKVTFRTLELERELQRLRGQ
jgi:PAS domain S-box-containing protein